MRKDILLGGVIAIVWGVLFLTVIPSSVGIYIAETQPVTKDCSFELVSPKTQYIMQIPLKVGDKVYIKVSINGSKNDVDLYIKDPEGYYVRSPSTIYSYYEYSFTAAKEGTYELWFDNSRSPGIKKHIDLEITIRPKGTAVEMGYPIFIPIGVVFIIIGVILTGLGIALKPRKAQDMQ